MTGPVWVVDRGAPDWEAGDLVEVARGRGMDARFVDWDELATEGLAAGAGGPLVTTPAAIVLRSPFFTRARPALRAHDFAMLRVLERDGVVIVNPADPTANAANKATQATLLARAGVATPRTIAVRSLEEVAAFGRTVDVAVTKPVYGHSSVALMLLGILPREDGTFADRELTHVFHMVRQQEQILLQEHHAPPDGLLLRATVFSGQVVAFYAIRQLPTTTPDFPGLELRSMERWDVELTPALEQLITATCEALELEVATLDIHGGDEPLVIEVNPVVTGWRTLAPHNRVGRSPADLYLDIVERRLAGG